MVTPPPEPTSARQQPSWWLLFGLMVLVGFLVSAAVVRLPYYAFRPGSIRDVRPVIRVEDQELYVPEGAISYPTVSLRPVTLFGLAAGWLDDDIDIFSRETVIGDNNPEEQRQLNLAMMEHSKEFATKVALEKLGWQVPVSADGELVTEVTPGMPADGVLEIGDTIVAIDGERIDEPEDLARIMSEKHPGDEVALQVRDLEDQTEDPVSMDLEADDQDPNRAVMGITVQAIGLEFDFPVDVTIKSGDVGGPSAGLAFTLLIIDELTPGELTGGKNVVATGEIHADGSVGPVGGVGQKAAAARREGADVFLVPFEEDHASYRAAVDHAGDDMEVIEVATVDEALAALAELGGNGEDLPQLGADQP